VPEPGYLVAAVLVSAAITWSLRAVPFALLAPLRSSRVVAHLGEAMPLGVMLILVGYTLRNAPFTEAPYAAPTLIALAATVGLHLWRRNVVLSIVGGTVVNVVLASTVLAAAGGAPAGIPALTCGGTTSTPSASAHSPRGSSLPVHAGYW
jgi:branched-subunit amino acid transport protein AzlD